MKRKGLITIKNLDSVNNPYAVDFDGYNEGMGNPCKDKDEVKEVVNRIMRAKSDKYTIEIKDERIKEIQRTL